MPIFFNFNPVTLIIPKHKQHEQLLILGNSTSHSCFILDSIKLCYGLKISLVLAEPNPAMSNTGDGPITSVMFILSAFSVRI